MRRTIQEFKELTGQSATQIGRQIDVSREVVDHWLKRKTPVFVTWDMRNDKISKVERVNIIYQRAAS